MRVVIDTNVLVSGLLSPFGPSGEIVRMISSGLLLLCYDARIISEYQDVLARRKFSFNQVLVSYLIDEIEEAGEIIASKPLAERLPDPDDEPFLEVAISAAAKCLITKNSRHFPDKSRQNMLVLTPSDFLDYYRKK